MDRTRAMELLKECLEEIPHLKGLHHDNQEYKLWRKKVINIIKAGLDADDENEFLSGPKMYLDWSWIDRTSEKAEQEHYLESLANYETNLESIIQKYGILGLEVEPATAAEPPKAFIAHGGESEALRKLRELLSGLNITPLVAEDAASQGRSINEQVEWCLSNSACAIILGTADDRELKDGRLYPRRNVYIEIGRVQERFPDKTIYLLEEGASFPSNISGKVYERFTPKNMEKAFIKVAKELSAFGILKAEKAEN